MSDTLPLVRGYCMEGGIAGYAWMMHLNESFPYLTGDENHTIHVIWNVAYREKIKCCNNCQAQGENMWCATGLDYWMSGLVIYFTKFWGDGNTGRGGAFRTHVIRTYLDQPYDRNWVLMFELSMIDVFSPLETSLRNSIMHPEMYEE